MNKANVIPAYIVNQYMHMENPLKTNLLVGGNIANQGSIIGRIYDLYSMPASLTKYLSRVTLVIDVGLQKKERLSNALNKIFGGGYDKSFVGGIKEKAIQQFTANAQQIIQQTLLDVDRKEASELRKAAIEALNKEAKKIFLNVQRQYQHDMPLFKALVRGEVLLYKK
jgi:CRISPR system Cascade subunit CasA